MWVFLIVLELGFDRDYLRRVRLFLLRRHAEREALKATLRAWARGQLSYERGAVESDRLSLWLDGTLKALSLDGVYGFVAGEDLRLALGLDDVISPGERDLLVDQLKRMRAGIQTRVAAVTTSNARMINVSFFGDINLLLNNKMGDINVDSPQTSVGNISDSPGVVVGSDIRISDSFKTISESAAPSDLKATLTELVEQVAAIATKLAPDEAAALSTRTDSLVREAVATKPDKNILEALGDGVKKVAQTVGDIGLPVVALVVKLLALI